MQNASSQPLQFKSKGHRKKKFNFATALDLPIVKRTQTRSNQAQIHSGDEASTLYHSNSRKLGLFNGNANPFINEKNSQMNQHNNNLRIVVANRRQVDQLRRFLSQRKLKIQNKYVWLSAKANTLKQQYVKQSDRLSNLANQINRLM